jgi:hypothetical protein
MNPTISTRNVEFILSRRGCVGFGGVCWVTAAFRFPHGRGHRPLPAPSETGVCVWGGGLRRRAVSHVDAARPQGMLHLFWYEGVCLSSLLYPYPQFGL